MKKYVALKNIPHNVGMIEQGQEFVIEDDDIIFAKMVLEKGMARLKSAPTQIAAKAPVSAQAAATSIVLPLAPQPEILQTTTVDDLPAGLDFRAATVCIMASGPSMSMEQAELVHAWQLRQSSNKTMVVNTTFRLAPWATVLYACDARWWEVYHEEVAANFPGAKWTQDKDAVKHGVNWIASQRSAGLSRKAGMINQGMSSGYQAMNFAYLAGARKIILLGFDCRVVDKQSHWHGDHPAPLSSSIPVRAWIEKFDKLAEDLKQDTVVLNSTPGTALECFTKMPLEMALAS